MVLHDNMDKGNTSNMQIQMKICSQEVLMVWLGTQHKN
jgi:hypothetical protein